MSKSQLYGPPKVGGDVLSYCTRCKMELAHVIVSMLDSRPAKVLCNTCKSQHNYRRTTGPGARKVRAPSQPRKRPAVRSAKLWEQKVSECKGDTLTYDLHRSFNSGDLINHSLFGVGFVEETKGSKIVVLFRQGEKVLIHGRT